MTKEFKLKNGSIVLIAEIAGGVYSPSHLKKIASLSESEAFVVKATEDHRLALLVNPEKAAWVASELRSIGLGTRNYQDGINQPVSCIGALCQDHEQDALETAMDITSELSENSCNTNIKIGVNGCSRCCTPCHTLDFSLIGEATGYRISVGGKNSQYPEFATLLAEGVPADEAPATMKKLFEIYQSNALEGESPQELLERLGPSVFFPAVKSWSHEPQAVELPESPVMDTAVPVFHEYSHDSDLTIDGNNAPPNMRDILVKTTDTKADFDIPINSDNGTMREIRIKEVELSANAEQPEVQSQTTLRENLEEVLEDGLEAKLEQGMSELADASEQLQSVADRESNPALLDAEPINFSEESVLVPEVEDEKLQDELVDITNKLSRLEHDLRVETTHLTNSSESEPWELKSFDLDSQGNAVFSWANGVKTIIDCTSQHAGSILIGRHKINFVALNGEIHVELNGFKIVLPSAA